MHSRASHWLQAFRSLSPHESLQNPLVVEAEQETAFHFHLLRVDRSGKKDVFQFRQLSVFVPHDEDATELVRIWNEDFKILSRAETQGARRVDLSQLESLRDWLLDFSLPSRSERSVARRAEALEVFRLEGPARFPNTFTPKLRIVEEA